MKSKSGQFYLITAVIIIAVIVGFVSISNYAERRDSVKIYNLGEELDIESENVLDYGTYNSLSKNETEDLLENFIEVYSGYIEEGFDIYLVIGNEESVTIIGPESLDDVTVDFLTGEVAKNFETKEFFPTEGGSVVGKNIIVHIDKNEYGFELARGEDFYFIIFHEQGEEKQVIIG